MACLPHCSWKPLRSYLPNPGEMASESYASESFWNTESISASCRQY